MRYTGRVFRPPSEAYSLIVQATIGCSHNKCAFCNMYKEKQFRVRPLEEVLEDFDIARASYPQIGRVFLADGDALILPQSASTVLPGASRARLRNSSLNCIRPGLGSPIWGWNQAMRKF